MAESIYSNVIFRRNKDSETEDLVNSYRFKSSSPSQYRKWSPEISAEDRFKKKRDREDEYIRQIKSDARPILVVKKKEVFHNKSNEDSMIDLKNDSFFKVSVNTQEIKDLEKAIAVQENTIKRETILKKGNLNVNDDESALFKIKGIEFLPRGFLELDPLLFKDEYHFDTESHVKMFQNEQRRMKALRRKQYAQKNKLKSREVTIFSLNEQKYPIIEYFEQWYFQHKRKMDNDEIIATAEKFNTSPEKIANLQEIYLKRSKLANEMSLQKYLDTSNAVRTKKISLLPPFLQKFFDKTKPASPLNTQHLNQSSEGAQPNASAVQLNSSKFDDKDKKDLSMDRSASVGPWKPSQIVRASSNLLNLYDRMISNMVEDMKLDEGTGSSRLQKDSVNKPKVSVQANFSASKPSTSPKPSIANKQSISKTSNAEWPEKKSRISVMDPNKINFEIKEEPMRVSRVINGKKTTIKEQFLRPTLVGNSFYFTMIQEIVDDFGKKAIFALTKNEEGKIVANQKLDERVEGPLEVKIIEDKPDEKGERKVTVAILNEEGKNVALQYHRPTVMTLIGDQYFDDFEVIEDPKGRKTVRLSTAPSKKSNISKTTITKIYPVLTGATHYSQIVVTEVDPNGRISSRLVTNDAEGKKVSEAQLPPQPIEQTFETHIANELLTPAGQRSFILATTNEQGKEIARTTVTPPPDASITQPVQSVVEEVVDKNGQSKISVLKPDEKNRLSLYNQKIVSTDETPSKKSIAPAQERQSRFSKIRTSILMTDFMNDLMKEMEIRDNDIKREKSKSQSQSGSQQLLNESTQLPEESKSKMAEIDDISRISKKSSQVMESPAEISANEPEHRPSNKSVQRKQSLAQQGQDISKKLSQAKNDPEAFAEVKKNLDEFVNNLRNSQLSSGEGQKRVSEAPLPKFESVQKKSVPQEDVKSSINYSMSIARDKSPKFSNSDVKDEKSDQNFKSGERSKGESISDKKQTLKQSLTGTGATNSDSLLKESVELKQQLESYIQKHSQDLSESKKPNEVDVERIRAIIKEVFDQERDKIAQEIKEKKKKPSNLIDASEMNNFLEFCSKKLPFNADYKDKILFTSLFYYFLEKKSAQNPF